MKEIKVLKSKYSFTNKQKEVKSKIGENIVTKEERYYYQSLSPKQQRWVARDFRNFSENVWLKNHNKMSLEEVIKESIGAEGEELIEYYNKYINRRVVQEAGESLLNQKNSKRSFYVGLKQAKINALKEERKELMKQIEQKNTS